MTTTPTSPRRATLAVGVLFFVNGATFSNWLPRIPEIRDSLGLSNDSLGVTLLGGGLGGIVGSLIVGRISDRLGSRHLVVLAATLLSIGMPLVAFVPNAPLLLVVLSALGILDVLNDVAMNTQGVIAQARMSRPIMNRLHAAWSLGFTSGALVGAAAAAARIGIRWHLCIVGAVLLATVHTVRRRLDPVDPPPTPHTENAGTAKRRRVSGLAVLVALAAIGAIGLEVLPNDWAAVLMRDAFDAGRFAGLGTVACAGAMLIGRLAGDHVLMRVGEHRLLVGAQVLVGAGAAITVATPFTAVAVTGLVVWGLGLSVFFPSLYSMAARLPGTSAGAGLGSMLFGQRSGALLVAVSTGAVGEWQGMRAAFAVVAGVSFVLLAVGMNRLRMAVATPATPATPAGA
ncbi:MAG: MFS transporter [Ilumatobacteraceae bacterium]